MEAEDKVKLVRAGMPISDYCSYLDTASVGAVSAVYADTLTRCTLQDLKLGRAHAERFDRIDRARNAIRQELADLLGVSAVRIELAPGTTGAIRMLLERFPWRPGDEIITTRLEFPRCLDVINEIASMKEVAVRIADVPIGDTDDISWLEQHVTDRTRLIAFSGVAYATGHRLPTEAIVDLAARCGACTLMDGAQIVGARQLDLGQCRLDFLALPVQKWLCGPEGLGALYAREDRADILGPDRVVHGWPVLEAAAAHLAWMRESAGWPFIYERTTELADYARRSLRHSGRFRLLTPESHAGLVSIECENDDSQRLFDRLRSRRIVVRHRPEFRLLRISTSFFNTTDEIDEFFATIQ